MEHFLRGSVVTVNNGAEVKTHSDSSHHSKHGHGHGHGHEHGHEHSQTNAHCPEKCASIEAEYFQKFGDYVAKQRIGVKANQIQDVMRMFDNKLNMIYFKNNETNPGGAEKLGIFLKSIRPQFEAELSAAQKQFGTSMHPYDFLASKIEDYNKNRAASPTVQEELSSDDFLSKMNDMIQRVAEAVVQNANDPETQTILSGVAQKYKDHLTTSAGNVMEATDFLAQQLESKLSVEDRAASAERTQKRIDIFTNIVNALPKVLSEQNADLSVFSKLKDLSTSFDGSAKPTSFLYNALMDHEIANTKTEAAEMVRMAKAHLNKTSGSSIATGSGLSVERSIFNRNGSQEISFTDRALQAVKTGASGTETKVSMADALSDVESHKASHAALIKTAFESGNHENYAQTITDSHYRLIGTYKHFGFDDAESIVDAFTNEEMAKHFRDE